MSNLEKINVLTKNKLDSLDLTQYPNQMFGTTDEVTEGGGGSSIVVDDALNAESENPVQNKVLYNPVTFAESERLKTINLFNGKFRQGNSSDYTVTNRLYCVKAIPMKAGKTYTFSTNLDTSLFQYVLHYLPTQLPSSFSQYFGWNTTPSYSVTPIEDCYLGICIAKTDLNANIAVSEIANYNFMVVEGTDTEYQEYYGKILHEADIENIGASSSGSGVAPNIITTILLADYMLYLDSTYYTVPLVKYNSVGTKLTMNSSNGVVVGSGVSKVKVSAMGRIHHGGYAGQIVLSIFKNGSSFVPLIKDTRGTSETFDVLASNSLLLNVNEGDVLSLKVKYAVGTSNVATLCGYDTNLILTSLTVEVVE